MAKGFNIKRDLRVIGAVCVVLLILAGCSTRNPTGPDSADVISIPMAFKSNLVTDYRLIIDAFDINPPIQVPLQLIAGFLKAEISVPAGFKRKFILEALSGDVVIYRGEQTVAVLEGLPLALDIRLWPQVPLINLTPRYHRIQMGEPFRVSLNAFNIPDIAGIACTLSVQTGPVDLDSITPGPTTAPSAILTQSQIFGSWLTRRVLLTSGGQGIPLLTDSDSHCLIELDFQTFDFWDYIFVAVDVEIFLEAVIDTAGGQIDINSIYVDYAEVEMFSTSGTKPSSEISDEKD